MNEFEKQILSVLSEHDGFMRCCDLFQNTDMSVIDFGEERYGNFIVNIK